MYNAVLSYLSVPPVQLLSTSSHPCDKNLSFPFERKARTTILLDFWHEIEDSLTWVSSIILPEWTSTASFPHALCQYYLFSTWLTCNLNSLNSNDNRLLCMGSHCIRGQGETDSLFVLCQWSLGPGLIRGAKAYTTPNQLQSGQLNLSQTY